MPEIFGYLVGLFVGVVMGLLGGGGSLLLPAMLWVFLQDESVATAHTAFLVGVTALFGFIPRWRKKEVDWLTVLALGVPVSVGMLIARLWLIKWIQPVLFEIGSVEITKQMVILFPFVICLLLSFATMMGFAGKNVKPRENMRRDAPGTYYASLVFYGLLIGAVPGLAGAGGGVLIVPLLVVLFGLPMKTVVGTSLAIVTMKSFIGFFGGDVYNLGAQIQWAFLAQFSILMIAGALIGAALSNKIDPTKLKKIFAWFILSIAIFIVVKETSSAVNGKTKPVPTNLKAKQPNDGHKYF
ncbi:MAG: sulfite exporter TauE/SafE family protein [Mariniblastus sp.]